MTFLAHRYESHTGNHEEVLLNTLIGNALCSWCTEPGSNEEQSPCGRGIGMVGGQSMQVSWEEFHMTAAPLMAFIVCIVSDIVETLGIPSFLQCGREMRGSDPLC